MPSRQPISSLRFASDAEAAAFIERLPKGDAAPIFGQLVGTSSKTPGHSQVAEILAKQAAESGKYEKVYLGNSVKTASGYPTVPRRNPDVLAVRKDGKIDVWEVESVTDNAFDLMNRGNKVMSQIPEVNRGTVIVARPSSIVKDINAANGNGNYLGKTSAQADAAFAQKQEGFIVVEWRN